MKEFKFRAWHHGVKSVSTNQWLTEPGYLYDEEPGDCFQWASKSQSTGPVEQFTGIRDVNGVEIYEGDIVRSYFWHKPHVFEFPDDIYDLVENDFAMTDLVVIGNIHESDISHD